MHNIKNNKKSFFNHCEKEKKYFDILLCNPSSVFHFKVDLASSINIFS